VTDVDRLVAALDGPTSGAHTMANVRTAHLTCNRHKRDLLPRAA
jgi:hypothetical protein